MCLLHLCLKCTLPKSQNGVVGSPTSSYSFPPHVQHTFSHIKMFPPKPLKTKDTHVLTNGFYFRTLGRSKTCNAKETVQKPREWRHRSSLCPVAASTAGVKDKPRLAVLLICDSIHAVPEGISVICYRIEAVCSASTEATASRASTPAPASAPTPASTPTSTSTAGRSCWHNGLRWSAAA